MIAANALSGQAIGKQSLHELTGLQFAYADQLSCIHIFSIVLGLGALNTVLQGFYNVWQVSQNKFKPLLRLTPLIMYYVGFASIFGFTEWAWENLGLVCILLTPYSSLINCRMIVSNVIKQEFKWFPVTSLWYLLFPLNRFLPMWIETTKTTPGGSRILMDESVVAWFIFLVIFAKVMFFVSGTIK